MKKRRRRLGFGIAAATAVAWACAHNPPPREYLVESIDSLMPLYAQMIDSAVAQHVCGNPGCDSIVVDAALRAMLAPGVARPDTPPLRRIGAASFGSSLERTRIVVGPWPNAPVRRAAFARVWLLPRLSCERGQQCLAVEFISATEDYGFWVLARVQRSGREVRIASVTYERG